MKDIKYVIADIGNQADADYLRGQMQNQFSLGWELFSVKSRQTVDVNNRPVTRFEHVLVRDTVYSGVQEEVEIEAIMPAKRGRPKKDA